MTQAETAPYKFCGNDVEGFAFFANSLTALLGVLRDPTFAGDWCELPTFGGAEPSDTYQVWSWDDTHLLRGTCAADLEIVPR